MIKRGARRLSSALSFHLVGHPFDDSASAAQRVDHHCVDAGFVSHDLLGAERDASGVLGRKRHGFVVGCRCVRLCVPPSDSGQRLDGYPANVDFSLLCGERHTSRLGMETSSSWRVLGSFAP